MKTTSYLFLFILVISFCLVSSCDATIEEQQLEKEQMKPAEDITISAYVVDIYTQELPMMGECTIYDLRKNLDSGHIYSFVPLHKDLEYITLRDSISVRASRSILYSFKSDTGRKLDVYHGNVVAHHLL
jgi:hypothetical protein